MLTINRRLALQLRSVLRRSFGSRGPGPSICFTAARGTLSVKAKNADIAVEYHAPHEHEADEQLWLPLELLADCAGKKDEPVEIQKAGKGRVSAHWRDGGVPQIVQYDAQTSAGADKFPGLPENLVENPPRLLDALTAAGETCDPDSVRYALGCLQFRGEHGSIVATDGRQLLVQGGFQFPWTGDILVPRSKVFASAELQRDGVVHVGKSDDCFAICVGCWTVYLAIDKDGRFPDVSRHIPRPDSAVACCLFSPEDVAFLAETLPRLPCDEIYNDPITVDVNGQVIVRAKNADQPRPTEVVLAGSSVSGQAIRININRRYLIRALRLGFSELGITGDKTALACFDELRQYVWMPLDPEGAIPPAEDAIRVVSPGTEPETTATQTRTKRRISPVTEPVNNPKGSATANGNDQSDGRAKTGGQAKRNGQPRNGAAHKPGQDIDGLIHQAEALRTSLRDTLVKTNELLKGLKRHRRQNRALQNTITSLRQLKTLGV